MSEATADARFAERLTGWVAPDAYRFAGPLVAIALVAALFGASAVALLFLASAAAVAAFFRNPQRESDAPDHAVLAPADGRIVAVGETETSDGRKALRIGTFLSVFDVHINRAPVSGRVRRIERSGSEYLAAFREEAETCNVRLEMELETSAGVVGVVQITGWIARRIVCQPEVGQELVRGARYGLIRFGSRTDVILPLGSQPQVAVGDRVRGGRSVLAWLEEERE